MATFKIINWIHYTNEDGKHPLKLRIIHNKRTFYVPLQHYVTDDEWDSDHNCPSAKHPNRKALSVFLLNKLTNAENAVLSLESKKSVITIQDILSELKEKKDRQTIYKYGESLVTELEDNNQFGTARSYREALSQIKMFRKTDSLYFEDITVDFLNKWERWHRSKEKGNSINSLNVYMRAIRSIFNKAITDKTVDKGCYPFDEYKIKLQKTKKRAIKKEMIDSIRDLNLPPDDKLYNSWNFFLFSFYCRGMNWKDLCLLKWSQIHDGRIQYKRSKTMKEFSIRINDNIQKILDTYKGKRKDFVFPIIQNKATHLIYKEIHNKNKIFNAELRLIAAKAEVDFYLTSYVARHSWASIAKQMNYSTEIISEGLGHGDLRTTQIYLDQFDDKIIDDANDEITK